MSLFIYCSKCGLDREDHKKLDLNHKITFRGDDDLSGDCRKLIMMYEFETDGPYKDDYDDTYKLRQIGRYIEFIRDRLDEMGHP